MACEYFSHGVCSSNVVFVSTVQFDFEKKKNKENDVLSTFDVLVKFTLTIVLEMKIHSSVSMTGFASVLEIENNNSEDKIEIFDLNVT